MDLVESLVFLEKRKLPVVDFVYINEKEDLERAEELGFPLVLKITQGHKTDQEGVIMNINSKTELDNNFLRLSRIGKGVVAQKQVSGVEVIVGVKKDNVFGHFIMFGIGGIFVEILDDVSFRLCPITKKDAREMINELKTKKILMGARNQKKVDLDKLSDLLVKISKIDFSGIKEMDLNPIIIDGNNFHIVDARIIS